MGRPYRCMTKATDRESGDPQRSFNWALSKRGFLRVYEDRIECGRWQIRADEVTEATLFRIRGNLLGGYVLQVRTGERTYQFGLNPWVRIADHLPFPFTETTVKLGYSRFSVVLRIAVVGYLIYLALGYLMER